MQKIPSTDADNPGYNRGEEIGVHGLFKFIRELEQKFKKVQGTIHQDDLGGIGGTGVEVLLREMDTLTWSKNYTRNRNERADIKRFCIKR